MKKDNIELFYEVRNLFNTSDEVFDIYGELRNRIGFNRSSEFGRNILLVFPTLESKKRNFNKYISKVNFYKINDNTVCTIDKYYCYTFMTINEILDKANIAGARFTDIRFLG